MTFETKPNTGALFRDERKTKDTDRDYSGLLNVDGTEFWISGWVKEAKSGQKYLWLSIKPKNAPAAKPEKAKPTTTRADDWNDEIPL